MTKYTASHDELRLTVDLIAPVNSSDFDRMIKLEDSRESFWRGSTPGFDIRPNFTGTVKDGQIELIVMGTDVKWVPGVPEANGPRFIGKSLVVES